MLDISGRRIHSLLSLYTDKKRKVIWLSMQMLDRDQMLASDQWEEDTCLISVGGGYILDQMFSGRRIHSRSASDHMRALG